MTAASDSPAAAERVAQTITVVAGVGTIVFFGLSLAPMLAAFPYLNPIYAVLSATFVFGMPVILAAVSRLLRLATLKRALGGYSIGFLVVVAAWIPAMTSSRMPVDVVPWPLEITALATVPAAIAWRPRVAWSYLVLNSVLIAPVRAVAAGGGDLSIPLQFALFTLTFSAIFTALAMISMKNGYALDLATARARTQEVRLVAVTAHGQERARLEALVHDEVASTLYYASRGDHELTDSVRKQAVRALSQLELARDDRDRYIPSATGVTSVRAQIELVQLAGPGPSVMMWGYFATMAVLALWSIDHVANAVPTIVGLILFAIITYVAGQDSSATVSLSTSVLVVLAWPVIAIVVSWQLTELGGFEQWYVGAATVSLFYIALRGRLWFAWSGFVTVGLVMITWGLTTPFGVEAAAVLIAKQFPVLVVGTLFAVGMRRTAERLISVSLEATRKASREAATIAVTAERDRAFARLDAFAAPLLQKIVDGPPPTASDLVEFAIAEAELRDGVRARALSTPSLVLAARGARRRGVDVVLMDDSDPAASESQDLSGVVAMVSSALDAATSGRIVARVLPLDRADVATLMVDDGPNSRYESIPRSTATHEGPPPPQR